MKRLYFQHMILSGMLVLALGACVHKPTKDMIADRPIEAYSPPPQQGVLLREARSESENLRSEVSSLKILVGKQMGELQSLREQSHSVHGREQVQGQELQNIRSQLISSQAERDQLRKHNMELEGQLSSLPDTSRLVSDLQSLRTSFQQIMSSMKSLASDMTLIKQELRITTNKVKPQQTKLSKNPPKVERPKNLTPDAKGRIVIQEGDTLWKLSRTYQVSVEHLREWNHLSSDLIMTGLHLKVTGPTEPVEVPPDQVRASIQPFTPEANPDNLDGPVQDMLLPDLENLEGRDTEPTHILSIARPQSDLPESP
ncbi:MAG: LysM peptidoglycan-binding domain-containing protein [Nitrospirales bacterium]